MKNDDMQVYREDVGNLGRVVTVANTLITAVLIAGIYFDNKSTTVAVLSGVAYFSFSTGLTLLALSHTLTDVITNRQEQVTVRELHRLQYHATQRGQSLLIPTDLPQLPYTNPVQETMQLPENTRFVAPHAETDDSAKREAAAWILQLYDATGHPDPKKVLMQSDKERPGRVKITAPSRSAKQYLLDRHIIYDLGNGFRLAIAKYPTIETVHQKLMQS